MDKANSARHWLRRIAPLFLLWHVACDRMASRQATTKADDDHDALQVMDSVHIDLTGAGATLPYPLYARWFNEYAQVANLRINYLSVGSGEGIAQLRDGQVDFGATDTPVDDSLWTASQGQVLHVPTVIGAVAVSYNLPRQPRPLRLDGDVLGDMFLGKITEWNDARLVALNPDMALPALPITVVHRSDASGTSAVMGEYLRLASQSWKEKQAGPTTPEWPVGSGVSGNEAMAAMLRQTAGAIGYVEVRYARLSRLPTAQLRNRAGRFVGPMPYEIASAATAVFGTALASGSGRSDLRRSLVDAPGADAYPLATLTWLLLPTKRLGPVGLRQMNEFLDWAFHEAGNVPSELGYVPLPDFVSDQVLSELQRAIATAAPPAR
jgi:phosphate transport system substrate-binding protein